MSAQSSGPPTLDNGLINGTNTYDDGGSRYEVAFTSGTSYRLRLVNGAVDTHFKFMIDNHTMTVIASDLVPITPYTTNVLDIGMGSLHRFDTLQIQRNLTNLQANATILLFLRTPPPSPPTSGSVPFPNPPAPITKTPTTLKASSTMTPLHQHPRLSHTNTATAAMTRRTTSPLIFPKLFPLIMLPIPKPRPSRLIATIYSAGT